MLIQYNGKYISFNNKIVSYTEVQPTPSFDWNTNLYDYWTMDNFIVNNIFGLNNNPIRFSANNIVSGSRTSTYSKNGLYSFLSAPAQPSSNIEVYGNFNDVIWSVNVWAKLNLNGGQFGGGEYTCYWGEYTYTLIVYSDGSADFGDVVQAIPSGTITNNWQMFTMTGNNGTHKFYIDGQLYPLAVPGGGSLIGFGSSYDGTNTGSNYFDELAVWQNRLLSDQEVTQLYNNGSGLFYS
jgi:hypothetical protein